MRRVGLRVLWWSPHSTRLMAEGRKVEDADDVEVKIQGEAIKIPNLVKKFKHQRFGLRLEVRGLV